MTPNMEMAGNGPALNHAEYPAIAAGERQYSDDEVRQLVAALQEPFDPQEIKWRVTNTTSDRRRGQMVAYADPRAYTDRLNELFTVRGWTRKYGVQTINNVERRVNHGTQIAGKVVITCEVSIFGLGTHSGIGEEWADNENAGTAAEAQAFKRACSCFGLGRYLYDLEGGWVDLDDRRQPRSTPKLPDWALPKRTQANGRQAGTANQTAAKQDSQKSKPATGTADPAQITALKAHVSDVAQKVGYSLSRWVLGTIPKVDSLDQVPPAFLAAVAEKLDDMLRGVERLRAATAVVGQRRYSQLCRDLNFASDSLDDIPDREALCKLLAILEKEARANDAAQNASSKRAANNGAQASGAGKSSADAARELGEARKALIKEAQRVAKLREMRVADVVNRAAKEAFTFANLQRLTADSLPAILSATKRLRDVAA